MADNNINEKTLNGVKVATGLITAIGGVLSSQYGIWALLGVGVLGVVGYFLVKAWLKKKKYTDDKQKSAEKAGEEASTGQQKNLNNRDKVDDFLGRKKRSGRKNKNSNNT